MGLSPLWVQFLLYIYLRFGLPFNNIYAIEQVSIDWVFCVVLGYFWFELGFTFGYFCLVIIAVNMYY